jgi:general secretion pathway protein A
VEWSRLGLNRRPFGVSADPEACFESTSTRAAITALDSAFERREGFALLDGPTGIGKTYTALAWLDRLPPNVPRIWLPSAPEAKPVDLLQAMLFDLEEPYQGLSVQELRLSVTARLLQALTSDTPIVLAIDEAQHLTLGALEELRLLGNVENRWGKGLFTLLVAQPVLRKTLHVPGTESLTQRLSTRCEMQPLSLEESCEYLRHHIALAGGDAETVLDVEGQELLANACGGIPRVLNQAAGFAFDLALAAEAEHVDAEAVLEVMTRLGLQSAETDESPVILEAARPAQPSRAANSKGKSDDASEKARQSEDRSPPKLKVSRRRSA